MGFCLVALKAWVRVWSQRGLKQGSGARKGETLKALPLSPLIVYPCKLWLEIKKGIGHERGLLTTKFPQSMGMGFFSSLNHWWPLFWYFPLWFHDTLIWLLSDMETGHILQVKLLGKQGEVCFHRCVKATSWESLRLSGHQNWALTCPQAPQQYPAQFGKEEACLYRHFHI